MFSIIGSICVGDKTSCGGTVVTGSAFSDVNGKPVARIGDKISCRKNCTITTGNPAEIIDGAPMALHGSQTSGNCTCLSNNNDKHGDGQVPGAAPVASKVADPGIAFMPVMAELLDEESWVEFHLVNAEDQPIPGQKFTLTDAAGKQTSGVLDDAGHARVSPVTAGTCSVNFPDLGHTISVESCPT